MTLNRATGWAFPFGESGRKLTRGEQIITLEAMPAGVHNGSLTQGARRERIISAIATGESISSICRREHISPVTVRALREVEWSRVNERKTILARQAERIATLAAERLTAQLESRDVIPANTLVPVFGVAVDKLAFLRDSPFTIKHEHTVRLADNDLLGFALSRSQKTAKATVIDSTPTLQDRNDDKSVILPTGANTHENGAKARSKRPTSARTARQSDAPVRKKSDPLAESS